MHPGLSSSVLIFALMILFPFCGFAEEQPQQQVLLFGCDRDYYPLSTILDDEVIGFDIELINRIAEYGGFKPEIKAGDWAGILRLLQDGEIDVVSGIIRTESRITSFDFSIPYLTEYYSVFVREDSPLEAIEDLKNGVCATLGGDVILETFIMPKGLNEGLIQLPSFDEAFSIVSEGHADYVIAPYSLGLSVMAKFGMKELELNERSLMTVDYRFAVKKGSGLLFLINESLAAAASAGIIEDLKNDAEFSRPFPVSSSTGRTRILKIIVLSAIFILLNIFVYAALRTRSRSVFRHVREENALLRRVLEALPLGVSWQFAGQEGGECNRIWMKYSEETDGFQTGNDDYKIEHLSLSGGNGSPDGLVRIAECRREHSEISSKCEVLVSDLTLRDVEIERLRITDIHTGLFNFNFLGGRIRDEFERYHLYGQKFCLFSVEIKERCVENLAVSANSIRTVLRRSDIIGYNGNGVLVIILPKTNIAEAGELLKKIMTGPLHGAGFTGRVYELPSDEGTLPAEIGELCR